MYVSYCPELDMASCGKSIEDAKNNLKEVISINFVECKKWELLTNCCKRPDFPKTRAVSCWPGKNWSVFLPLKSVSDVSDRGLRRIRSRLRFSKLPAAGMSELRAIILSIHILGAMRPVVIPKYQEVPAFIIKNKRKTTRGKNIRAEADYNPHFDVYKRGFCCIQGRSRIFAALIKSRLKEGNETCSPAKR